MRYRYEYTIFVTRPLLSGDPEQNAKRRLAASRKLVNLRRQGFAVIATNTLGNSILAYTLQRAVRR